MKEESIFKLIEQHYQHARHVENERMWFGTLYTATVGSILLLAKVDPQIPTIKDTAVLIFLIVLSILGVLISLKLYVIFESHKQSAWELKKLTIDPQNERDLKISKYLEPQFTKHRIRGIKVSRLFPAYYLICMCGLSITLINQFFHNFTINLVANLLIYSVITYLIWKTEFYRREDANG